MDCPYLTQINKQLLDFDFEKACSVSLSRVNVYACLVCGKFFQGRSRGSHAYLHSIEREHFVWVNLHTCRFYCLPDDYEILCDSKILTEIRNLIKPCFDFKSLKTLDTDNTKFLCVDGLSSYQPGIIGMIVLKQADYINAVLHALLFVKPLRNHLLLFDEDQQHQQKQKNNFVGLLAKFSELAKRVWSPHNFRSHVSVNEILHSISLASKSRFDLNSKQDPSKFLVWFVNSLDQVLNQVSKKKKSVVKKSFQGAYKKLSRDYEFDRVLDTNAKKVKLADVYFDVKKTHFCVLPLTVPDPMIVKAGQSIIDQLNTNYLPRVPITELLKKFDGVTETINVVNLTETTTASKAERYKLLALPSYLILVLIRKTSKQEFHASAGFTIVDFDIARLDLSTYINNNENNVYRLIANITLSRDQKNVEDHIRREGAEQTYSLQVLHEPSKKWYQIRDVEITEIRPETIVYSESCLMIWEKV